MQNILELECHRCKQVFPARAEFFYRNGKRNTWLRPCKSCRAVQREEWRAKNREKTNAYSRDWARQNREKRRVFDRNYRAVHRDRLNEMQRERYKRCPSKALSWNQNRRARKKSAEGSYTAADILLQYNLQSGKCWWCGKPLNGKYDVDHRIALVNGGTNWPNNLVCSCQPCNSSKKDRDSWVFNGRLL